MRKINDVLGNGFGFYGGFVMITGVAKKSSDNGCFRQNV